MHAPMKHVQATRYADGCLLKYFKQAAVIVRPDNVVTNVIRPWCYVFQHTRVLEESLVS